MKTGLPEQSGGPVFCFERLGVANWNQYFKVKMIYLSHGFALKTDTKPAL